MLAIAPNANNALIPGVSPSIEPWSRNYFVQPTVRGSFATRNKHLDTLLQTKTNSPKQLETWWRQILVDKGSVQNLGILDEWEKSVFKTAYEIDQRALVRLAADRQKHICQSQSFNVFIPAKADIGYISEIHYQAWKQGMKTVYYLRSIPVAEGTSVSFDTSTDCLSCAG